MKNGLAADTTTWFPPKVFLFIIIIFFYGNLIGIQCPSARCLELATKLLHVFS